MMSSPENSPPTRPKSSRGRPSTPHPHRPPGKPLYFASSSGSTSIASFSPSQASMGLDFIGVEESEHHATPPESCIGISLATVMNTFRGTSSTKTDLPTSPMSMHSQQSMHGDDNNIFHRFFRIRSTIQKTLSCADGRTYRASCRSNTSASSNCMDDRHLCDERHFCEERQASFEALEREKSLMQRAASWSTQETENESALVERKSNVQFHYPPITSVRLRPRTGSDEIKQLFFAPEELDEIEDDRSDTRAADDIETLAVGAANWNAMPHSTSSIVTASDYDDQDSRSGLLLAGDGTSNVMFDHAPSPKKRDNNTVDRRFVRGVQIMLREKSTG
mmetsp:Transcript_3740/g.7858  ORF Transcript_3740/g.7858 Transcript_3740/m.7858 type:complete len:334 (-) Transcript_3740:123-1124(-)|eukprot:CAMPEP_0172527386 /NCGR_PEP_ID=MMETSP1067-20121228/2090_1 /TAXON_ID=265564 ORGANISM="Thalassiosira punctigera, Strain Tpunct2005C2" /NCGR_SAMPLE_ID=MMETSP1067 /ASSEMBLY_ACC=CAM_ASM_000444 /LENGTH=333 /DNA_ID=CAMNT_0013311117 /DNA_START=159 /DNA_END=1160 /DNA_ORIENTATION=-